MPQENNLIFILDGCRKNIPKFQKELYDTFCGYALSVCMRYTKDRNNALEIMNDGFVKVFRGLHQFIYPGEDSRLFSSFRSWVKQIMIYTAIDHYRSASKQTHYLEVTEKDNDTLFDKNVTYPFDMLSYKELISMIQLLPSSYRTAFNLYVIDGFSHEEIAGMLGISVSTSRSNLAKAKEHLRNRLKKTYEKVLVKYN